VSYSDIQDSLYPLLAKHDPGDALGALGCIVIRSCAVPVPRRRAICRPGRPPGLPSRWAIMWGTGHV
jgi:hypothetical protein